MFVCVCVCVYVSVCVSVRVCVDEHMDTAHTKYWNNYEGAADLLEKSFKLPAASRVMVPAL